MRQQGAKRVGAMKVRYPNELASCGRSHARATGLQSVSFCPRLCLARQNGQQTGSSLLERKRWWLTAPFCRADHHSARREKRRESILNVLLHSSNMCAKKSKISYCTLFSERKEIPAVWRPASGMVSSCVKRRRAGSYLPLPSASLIYLITLGILYLCIMTKGTSIRQASTDVMMNTGAVP